MKTEIMILNAIRYKDKKTNEDKVRLGFVLCGKDSFSDSTNFKGFSEVANFYNDGTVIDKITKEMVGKPLVAHLREYSSLKDPMRKRYMIESVEVNGSLVNLLQA